ncbi:MAG: LacI family transcriptional regulator [Actinobacteria bacterium]|nr:LacI family transcriptional regulator [Actinomycetota bacterium]
MAVNRPSSRPTLKDVADRADVSPQTVSNYLSGRHATRSGPRERIELAIRELDYRPNAAARALRSRRADTIALVLEDPNALGLHEYFHMEFLNGATAAAHAAGNNLMVTLTRPDETLERALRIAREGRADGLALSLGDASAAAAEMRELAGIGLPVVLLQQTASVPGVSSITAEDEVGAAAAVAHLVGHGHRRIAWLCGRELWPGPERRFAGVREAAAAADVDLVGWTCEDFTVRSAREAVAAELAGHGAAPTAVIAANDMIALGVVQQLQEEGLGVPDDISVVGFNDFDFSSWVRPSLTTVRIPAAAMGRRAVEVLLAAEDGAVPEAPVFPAELVVRESSGPAPAA